MVGHAASYRSRYALTAPCEQVVQLRTVWPACHRPNRSRQLCRPVASEGGSKGDGGKKDRKGDDKADFRKADISAYWALKVREFFSPRKKYLDKAKGLADDEQPEFIKRLQRSLDEEKAEMERIQTEQLAARIARAEARRAAEGNLAERADAAANAAVRKAFGDSEADAPPPLTREQLVMHDLQMAQDQLHSVSVQASWQMTALRMQRLVFEFVMFPITLIKTMRSSWAALFTTQRYENFLMAEGEQIWAWRNRTENERWFWEIFAWDRLIFPTICAVTYQALVPNNFVWAVIIPLSFIYWQSGELPGPWHYEFWLVAYFGFWRKCWPQFAALTIQLLNWA